MDLRTELTALTDDLEKTLKRFARVADRTYNPVNEQYAPIHGFISGSESVYDIVVMRLRQLLDAHPPTGYDVYCSQDAPTFAHWERVAASVKDENFVAELVHGSEDWASAVRWQHELTEAELFSEQYPRIHRHPVLRRYRILPAGSPPPGNEVSE